MRSDLARHRRITHNDRDYSSYNVTNDETQHGSPNKSRQQNMSIDILVDCSHNILKH